MMQPVTDASEFLTSCLHNLHPLVTPPVDLLALSQALDVDLRIRPPIQENLHGTARKLSESEQYVVTVFAKLANRGLLTTSDRFTIAHEFGHVLLARAFGSQVATRRSHWREERLCNEFASKLLVPDSLFSEKGFTQLDDPIVQVQRIAMKCGVSLVVASKRLADRFPHITIFNAILRKDARNKRVLSVQWSAPDNNSRKIVAKKYLRHSDELGSYIIAAAIRAAQQKRMTTTLSDGTRCDVNWSYPSALVMLSR